MQIRTRSVLVSSLVTLPFLLAVACQQPGPTRQATAEAAPGDEEEGDPARDAWVLPDEMGEVYAANCAVCHGRKQEGSSLGPSLLGDLQGGDGLEEIVRSIAEGAPDADMPPWRDTLPEDEIRGLAIYLLEKRQGDRGADGQGVGAPPTIPTAPIPTEHYALRIETIYTGLSEPYSIAPLPDGRFLVTEKMRGISIVEADGSAATLVEGTPRIYDDSVLRGTAYTGTGWAHEVALHPDYAENGWIYFVHGDRCDDCNAASRTSGRSAAMLRLVRGRLDGHRWVDQETIWEAPKETYQIDGAENGAGARLAFDDRGYVYMTVGHYTDYAGVQDLSRPDGKTIRLHEDGRTPEDNPFVDEPGALASTWTLGHRVAQGLDYDPSTGLLWSTEHGPRGGDEANWLRPGHNYGWPMFSLGVDYDGRPIPYAKKLGLEYDPADLTGTMIDWTPSPGVSSIVFYRGPLFAAWQNHLIVGTLSRGDLWRYVVDEHGARERETLIEGLGRFRDVEVGPNGELIALLEHRSGSMILRIEPAER